MSDDRSETYLQELAMNGINPDDPVQLAHDAVKSALEELGVLSNNNASQAELDLAQEKVKAAVKVKNQALRARKAELEAMDDV